MTHLNKLLSAANWPAPEIALDIASDEIERLLAGGCDRDQGTTQHCAEAARMATRIELLEGYLRGALNVIEGFVACDTKNVRAVLDAKP